MAGIDDGVLSHQLARLAASRMSVASTRASNALERTSSEVEQAVVASQLKAGPHCVRGARCTVLRTHTVVVVDDKYLVTF